MSGTRTKTAGASGTRNRSPVINNNNINNSIKSPAVNRANDTNYAINSPNLNLNNYTQIHSPDNGNKSMNSSNSVPVLHKHHSNEDRTDNIDNVNHSTSPYSIPHNTINTRVHNTDKSLKASQSQSFLLQPSSYVDTRGNNSNYFRENNNSTSNSNSKKRPGGNANKVGLSPLSVINAATTQKRLSRNNSDEPNDNNNNNTVTNSHVPNTDVAIENALKFLNQNKSGNDEQIDNSLQIVGPDPNNIPPIVNANEAYIESLLARIQAIDNTTSHTKSRLHSNSHSPAARSPKLSRQGSNNATASRTLQPLNSPPLPDNSNSANSASKSSKPRYSKAQPTQLEPVTNPNINNTNNNNTINTTITSSIPVSPFALPSADNTNSRKVLSNTNASTGKSALNTTNNSTTKQSAANKMKTRTIAESMQELYQYFQQPIINNENKDNNNNDPPFQVSDYLIKAFGPDIFKPNPAYNPSTMNNNFTLPKYKFHSTFDSGVDELTLPNLPTHINNALVADILALHPFINKDDNDNKDNKDNKDSNNNNNASNVEPFDYSAFQPDLESFPTPFPRNYAFSTNQPALYTPLINNNSSDNKDNNTDAESLAWQSLIKDTRPPPQPAEPRASLLKKYQTPEQKLQENAQIMGRLHIAPRTSTLVMKIDGTMQPAGVREIKTKPISNTIDNHNPPSFQAQIQQQAANASDYPMQPPINTAGGQIYPQLNLPPPQLYNPVIQQLQQPQQPMTIAVNGVTDPNNISPPQPQRSSILETMQQNANATPNNPGLLSPLSPLSIQQANANYANSPMNQLPTPNTLSALQYQQQMAMLQAQQYFMQQQQQQQPANNQNEALLKQLITILQQQQQQQQPLHPTSTHRHRRTYRSQSHTPRSGSEYSRTPSGSRTPSRSRTPDSRGSYYYTGDDRTRTPSPHQDDNNNITSNDSRKPGKKDKKKKSNKDNNNNNTSNIASAEITNREPKVSTTTGAAKSTIQSYEQNERKIAPRIQHATEAKVKPSTQVLGKPAENGVVELTASQKKDLFTKCRNNRYEAVEELFHAGISVDTADKYGNQCIHIACQNGNKKMVKLCLRYGADINAQNLQGNTPLHYLFAYNYDNLAAYLISKNANDAKLNFFGYSCYDGLRPESKEEALQLLHQNAKNLPPGVTEALVKATLGD